MQGPTAMPSFNSAGYNTSVFSYPQTANGHDVYYNEYQNIEVRKLCSCRCLGFETTRVPQLWAGGVWANVLIVGSKVVGTL